jgi:hypothetical protein
VYLHEGNGVRVGNADNLFTIATDFKTALTAKMRGEVRAAYTRSEPIVTMAESLIRHDMYMAEIFLRFGPQIDEAFGPFMLSLRRSYFSPDQLARLNETLGEILPGSGRSGVKTSMAAPPERPWQSRLSSPRSMPPHLASCARTWREGERSPGHKLPGRENQSSSASPTCSGDSSAMKWPPGTSRPSTMPAWPRQ